MKIRQARKILSGKLSKKKRDYYSKLRPSYEENGRTIYPSWSDIDIFRRANKRLEKYIKRIK